MTMALWDVIEAEAMTCQFHARIDPSGYVRLLWESEDDRNGHAAIFEVKFGNKTEGATTKSRERSAEQPLTPWGGLH